MGCSLELILRQSAEMGLLAVAYGDRLQFEMSSTQQRAGADEFSGRQILGREICPIDGVEFIEERQVRARNLDVYQIVHRQSPSRQRGLYAVEEQMDLDLHVGGSLPRFGIEADTAGKVERVAR